MPSLSHLKSLAVNQIIMCLYTKGKGLLLERCVYMTLIGWQSVLINSHPDSSLMGRGIENQWWSKTCSRTRIQAAQFSLSHIVIFVSPLSPQMLWWHQKNRSALSRFPITLQLRYLAHRTMVKGFPYMLILNIYSLLAISTHQYQLHCLTAAAPPPVTHSASAHCLKAVA